MLAWMDLEMTGLDAGRDRIVEIATLITDDDLELVAAHGLHLTYGSALDLFGGDLPYADVVAASRRLAAAGPPLTR